MSMKRRVPRVPLAALALVAALTLAGCATTAPYGNFIPPAVAVDPQPLAAEASRQLAALWPPARTRFELQQATPDAFGAALVGELRAAGYAVLEASPTAASAAGATDEAQDAAPADPAAGFMPTPVARPLGYVLDHDAGSGLYRLTLRVGSQSLTRAYREQDRSLVAAGYWVRKE